MSVEAPERIWAASVTDSYGEWQTVKDGLPRPVEYVRADKLEELELHARHADAYLQSAQGAIQRADKAEVALAEKDKEIAGLREALNDLLSWFPDKPSDPEWRIAAGVYGADEAVSVARNLARNAGGKDGE